MAKRREIRNSTAEFHIFQIEGKEQGIEVYYKDKTVWCTQKAMGMLFDCFNRKPNYDPCLFSEQEMQGGVCIDNFDQKEDAYLEAIRIVCKLDDVSFIALGEEVEQQYRFAETYWIRSLPGYIMSHSQFEALREIIGIRHGYNNNYYSFQKPHVTFLTSFEKAKKRFEDELPKEEYKYVEWITSI